MALEPTYKYAEMAGIDKPKKQLVDVYDSICGEYEDHAGDNRISQAQLKPSPHKVPFGQLSKGK